jgi:hypothetical protein
MELVEKNEQITLEMDYAEIMKGFQYPTVPTQPVPQWSNPTDFIVKFSLYQESPNSITSTETSVNLADW